MTDATTTTLFRPVGPEELELIRPKDLDAFNAAMVDPIEIVAAFGDAEGGP